MSSAAGAGNAVPGWLSMRGSSTSMTGQLAPVQPVGQLGGGDRGDRRGIGEHELDPRRRQRRVDRQIGRPGLEHRQRSPRSPRRTAGTAAPHTRPGPHHVQSAGAPTGSTPRRARDTSSSGRRRSAPPPPGCGPPARRTTPESTPARSPARSAPPGYPISSSRACSPASSTSTDDNRRVGSAVIATNTRSQPLDQRLDAVRVEHVGAELHRPGDPGGLTGLGAAFGQGERQIHAGGVGVDRQRGDLQITQGQPGGGVVVCARRSSARPTSPGPAGDGSAIGWG